MNARALAATVAVIATFAFVVALVVRPNDHAPALDAFILLLGALGLGLLVHATARSFPPLGRSELERALETKPRKADRNVELESLERSVDMATQSAFDTYYRLRPQLRAIAGSRLATLGIDLDDPDGRAPELLGEEAWAIVRPDVRRPSDHFAPGADLETIERAVTALETI